MGLKTTSFEMLGRLSILIIAVGPYEMIIKSFDKIIYDMFSVIVLIICLILGLIWVQLPLINDMSQDKSEWVKS